MFCLLLHALPGAFTLTGGCFLLQPVYFALFGFHVFGLGFITSMVHLTFLMSAKPWTQTDMFSNGVCVA
jgi:hypothetical protein